MENNYPLPGQVASCTWSQDLLSVFKMQHHSEASLTPKSMDNADYS